MGHAKVSYSLFRQIVSKKFGVAAVPVSGWTAVSGLYEAKITDETVKPGRFVTLWESNGDVDITAAAEILPSVYIYEGYFCVRCKNIPTATINFRYVVQ